MTGTTEVAGVTVNCECTALRQIRFGPDVVETVYLIMVAGLIFTTDNFTEDKHGRIVN